MVFATSTFMGWFLALGFVACVLGGAIWIREASVKRRMDERRYEPLYVPDEWSWPAREEESRV